MLKIISSAILTMKLALSTRYHDTLVFVEELNLYYFHDTSSDHPHIFFDFGAAGT